MTAGAPCAHQDSSIKHYAAHIVFWIDYQSFKRLIMQCLKCITESWLWNTMMITESSANPRLSVSTTRWETFRLFLSCVMVCALKVQELKLQELVYSSAPGEDYLVERASVWGRNPGTFIKLKETPLIYSPGCDRAEPGGGGKMWLK